MLPIEPIEFELNGKTYTLSKFPAVAGREIIAKYPLTAMPKLGDYAVNEETMLKLMRHVYIKVGDHLIALENKTLVDNHVKSWEDLAQIEWEMLRYNCSFFQQGRISTFFADIVQKLPTLITRTLTDLSVALSEKGKQPSEN